jgi:hypothetical protein
MKLAFAIMFVCGALLVVTNSATPAKPGGGLLVPEVLRHLHEEGDHQCRPVQQGLREEV